MTENADQHTARRPRDRTTLPTTRWVAIAVAMLLSNLAGERVSAQYSPAPSAPSETTEQKVQRLTAAVARAQAQMDAYQKQLQDMQKELSTLQNELAVQKGTAPAAPAVSQNSNPGSTAAQNVPPAVSSSASAATLEDIRERQAVQESQIATHEQTKVETESKYPVKISGLLLFNSYVNTRQVDISAQSHLCIAGVRQHRIFLAPDRPGS